MRLITNDDIFDVYYRLNLKGWRFLNSKFRFNSLSRTYSSFNSDEMLTSNWWNIPDIRKRWNLKITGSTEISYVDYVFEKYLKNLKQIKLLSPGCGVCSNEIKFAGYPAFSEIFCIDLAEKPLKTAETIAFEKKLGQMKFLKGNVNEIDFPAEYYDVVLFNSSLHHFKNVEGLLGRKISETLKPGGLLIINEYVGPNRLQWTNSQLKAVNLILQTKVPEKFRQRYRSGYYKNKVSGPGILRMIFSDPSEAVDSASILPSLKGNFTALEEKQLGGNLLMILLKDISHHFTEEDKEAADLLKILMEIEDDFIETTQSDNIFGVYQKTKS
jgi:2-polyprenyl-3-methyl-5-hydroxy-6-metoxy-1,4-benzoquinol methylase